THTAVDGTITVIDTTNAADAIYNSSNSGLNADNVQGAIDTLANQLASTINIYNSDDTLTGNRTVTMNDHTLIFENGNNYTSISNNGTQALLSSIGSSRGAFRVKGGSAIVD